MGLQVEVNEQSNFEKVMSRVVSNHPAFFWSVLKTKQVNSTTKEYRPYVYNGLLKLTTQQKEEIQKASQIIYDIIERSTRTMIDVLDEQTLEAFGFPQNALSLAEVPFLENVLSYISRLDLAITEEGEIKCLEINPSTPFMINEGFECADMVCSAFGEKPINEHSKTLFKLNLMEILRKSSLYLTEGDVDNGKRGGLKTLNICTASVTASDCYEEYRTVEFFVDCLIELGYAVTHVKYEDLDVREDGVYIPYSQSKVDVLFLPAYPYEFLLNDEGGAQVIDLMNKRELVVLNPPSSYFMHNKALFALIWGLKDNDDVFTEQDRLNIEKYFIPTYMTAQPFLDSQVPFVQKTVFGREGNSVFIYDETGSCINTPTDMNYMDFPSIFQTFVDISKHEGKTIVIGSFLLSGFPSSIVARIGEAVTDGEAFMLPICL